MWANHRRSLRQLIILQFSFGSSVDLNLGPAQTSDRLLADLWKMLQSLRVSAGNARLLGTTQHGRDLPCIDWTDHGKDVPGAEFNWIALFGPGVQPIGVRSDVEVTQSQIAGTIAHWVGEDFRTTNPKAAMPIPGLSEAISRR
jgi:hypothetical protein